VWTRLPTFIRIANTGRDPPVCHGSDIPCSCDSPAPGTTEIPSTDAPSDDCSTADMICKNVAGDVESYCKYWQDPPVCHGTDVACSCGVPAPETTETPPDDCEAGDMTCRSETGMEISYCKYWLDPPVCHESDIPCEC
jgi:hypothetical protein